MEIRVRDVQGVTVAELAGELNWKAVPEAEERILAAAGPGTRMVLDLSRLQFMSSAGLRLLLKVYRAVAGRDGRALLAAIPPRIREIMTVTGFLDLFAHRDTVESGVAELASGTGRAPVREG